MEHGYTNLQWSCIPGGFLLSLLLLPFFCEAPSTARSVLSIVAKVPVDAESTPGKACAPAQKAQGFTL